MGSPVFSRGVRLIEDMLIWRKRGEDREHEREEKTMIMYIVCSIYVPRFLGICAFYRKRCAF